MSLLSGIGTNARDKRRSHTFLPDVVDWDTAENLYRGDPLAARIVDTKPTEMLREGFDFCVQLEDDQSDSKVLQEAVEGIYEDIELIPSLLTALKWERCYGGGAILIGVDDGTESLRDPVIPTRIRRGKGVNFLTTLEPRELQPVAWYGDPLTSNYRKPAIYRLSTNVPGNAANGKFENNHTEIHESRLIVFPGIRVSERSHQNQGGWGDSVFTRVGGVLRDFNLSWAAAGILVCDFAQAVYKMKGLNDLLADDEKDIFKQRMLGMDFSRSVTRSIMIDADDEYGRQQTPVTGLPDLLDRFATHLAAAADMPLSLLMGESPGGINASGASGDQMRMFYDKIAAESKSKVVPAVRKITQYILRGMGIDA